MIVKRDSTSFVCSSGDQYHIEYSSYIDAEGCLSLREVGKVDIREMINSYKDTTDMSFILAQLSNGNSSVLHASTPMYGDFTHMPKSPAEALQMVIDAQDAFRKLPSDIKNKFGNSFERWFASSGSATWFADMGVVKKSDDIKVPVAGKVDASDKEEVMN